MSLMLEGLMKRLGDASLSWSRRERQWLEWLIATLRERMPEYPIIVLMSDESRWEELWPEYMRLIATEVQSVLQGTAQGMGGQAAS